jgi:hypothetical protein
MTMDDLTDPKTVGSIQAKAFTSSLDVRHALYKTTKK